MRGEIKLVESIDRTEIQTRHHFEWVNSTRQLDSNLAESFDGLKDRVTRLDSIGIFRSLTQITRLSDSTIDPTHSAETFGSAQLQESKIGVTRVNVSIH